ncbi:MAG: DNA repair exonuclease [Clostridia bacterium]|nr:DNA repair exonuclease [Clostridia bacterium]
MSFKLVHCADLHIGASLSGLSESYSSIRREEIKSSLKYIADFSLKNCVDAILICGDLFDSPFPSQSDINYVKNIFKEISDINIYINCGNHDYLAPSSVFTESFSDLENIYIFPSYDSCFEIEDKNVVLWGKSYSAPSVEPSFENVNTDKEKINIMCLHGVLTEGDNYPISKQCLSRISPEYAAFGHIHDGCEFIVGETKCAYSGTPEGHGFNDCGNTGFIYAEISKNSVKLEKIESSKRKYTYLDADISGLNSNDEIIASIKDKINPDDLFKVILKGEATSDFELSTSYIEDSLKESCFYIKIYNETSPALDFSLIEKEESLRGYFIHNLKEIATEEEFMLAARIGLNALLGRKTDL